MEPSLLCSNVTDITNCQETWCHSFHSGSKHTGNLEELQSDAKKYRNHPDVFSLASRGTSTIQSAKQESEFVLNSYPVLKQTVRAIWW